MARVLIVEDHRGIADMLRGNLQVERHEVRIAADGQTAVDMAAEWHPDLMILDLMLPILDGFEVLRRTHGAATSGMVLVLSARGGEAEKVRALRLGADDYMVKPFGLLELIARTEALLRRAERTPTTPTDPPRYLFGSIEVMPAARLVRRSGIAVPLRPREYDLLLALLRAEGAVVSRKELLSRVWGYDPAVVTRTVDTHVATLRARLEEDADRPRHILTVWKTGYRLVMT
ncbi:MAG: response regulator transcription factor [Gemmatimonadales bacterium]|nr:response regulator transcription factor [Gemmatimonadales bacterium]